MGERDLAGPHPQAAAHQRRHAGGMMRAAERALVGERPALDLARDRSHHGDFEQFGRRQRRQDGGQPRRQHGLAGTGRADQQQVMAAGGRDLERPLGALLALDVLEIDAGIVRRADFRLRARQQLRAAEMIGELDERARRHDLHLGARPGGFRAASGRADEALLARIGPDRGRQHAGDRRDRAVEAELAQHGAARQRIGRNGADLRHQAERDRQIVVAAFLRQVGRRQIDGDAPRRQRQARRPPARPAPAPWPRSPPCRASPPWRNAAARARPGPARPRPGPRCPRTPLW